MMMLMLMLVLFVARVEVPCAHMAATARGVRATKAAPQHARTGTTFRMCSFTFTSVTAGAHGQERPRMPRW